VCASSAERRAAERLLNDALERSKQTNSKNNAQRANATATTTAYLQHTHTQQKNTPLSLGVQE